MRFDLFSPAAREVLEFAREDAQAAQHTLITNAHLLTALMRHPATAPHFKAHSAALAESQAWLAQQAWNSPSALDLSEDTRYALRKAQEVSLSMGHLAVDAPHIAVGVLSLHSGAGEQLLRALGANRNALLRDFTQALRNRERYMIFLP
jgi:ATP-dependent Clp protease ATP-binding subunit ClpA